MIQTSLFLVVVALLFQNCSGGFRLGSDETPSNLKSRMAQAIRFPSQNPGTGIYLPSGRGEGVNTMLVSHALYGKFGRCTNCPAWIGGLSMPAVRESLAILGGTSLNHYREIVEASRFFPAPNQVAHVDDLVALMEIYQQQGATLMLSLGTPIPSWMNPELAATGAISYAPTWPEGGRTCFLPQSDIVWEQLKNNMSESLGLLAQSLWNHPRLSQTWMRDHLLFDPINEFDSFQGGPNCSDSDRHLYATGRRAAGLTGGIQFVFNKYQLPFIVTMPSGATGTLQYFEDFYKYGGLAQANVHAYFRAPNRSPNDPLMAQDYADFLAGYLAKVNAVIPPAYRNNIVLGEFGNFLTDNAYCRASTVGTCSGLVTKGLATEKYLTTIFADQRIRAIAPLRMSWMMVDSTVRTYTSPVIDAPYSTAGFITSDLVPKTSLFRYLESFDGIDLSKDRVRLAGLRSRVRSALTTPSDDKIDRFVRDLIFEVGDWNTLVSTYNTVIATPTPTPTPAPATICSGVLTVRAQNLCQAYRDLFDRLPDRGGFDYWNANLTTNELSCTKKILAYGTAASDCAIFQSRVGVPSPSQACGGTIPLNFGCP